MSAAASRENTVPNRTRTNRARQWTAEKRAAQAQIMRMRNADPAFKRQAGFLSEQERGSIIAQARAGAPHIEIATDWLISSSHVSRIATQAGVRRQNQNRGKP